MNGGLPSSFLYGIAHHDAQRPVQTFNIVALDRDW